MGKGKTGRNDPCPCGSGKKFKRCHGDAEQRDRVNRAVSAAQEHRLHHEAKEKQRREQQGLSKPIISTQFQDHRLVAVGNRVYYSRDWKTFADFLIPFLRGTLGSEWGANELRKPQSEMHPVTLWHVKTGQLQAAYKGKPGEVFSAPETGASRAYLELAYNLYLLQHNVELQTKLIIRLKHPDQFSGALSEIRVAGMFVRAGFDVCFEDENDASRSHYEYSVTRSATGKRFSVEVKTKHWTNYPQDDSSGRELVRRHVGRLLRLALAKQADFDRIVWIELAMPSEGAEDGSITEPWWMKAAVEGIEETEQLLREHGKLVPPAIVIVSNHPHHLHLESTRSIVALAIQGIGPTEFRSGLTGTVHEAVGFRERHADFLAFWESVQTHRHIPTTFDGANRYLAFTAQPPRLIIGQRYQIPDASGELVAAILEDAAAIPESRQMTGIYRTDLGERVICTNEMTEQEVSAYNEHPDTFFGVVKQQRPLNRPLELYDFFCENYRNTPRERLLELMNSRPDREAFQSLSQEQLVRAYCEGLVSTIVERSHG